MKNFKKILSAFTVLLLSTVFFYACEEEAAEKAKSEIMFTVGKSVNTNANGAAGGTEATVGKSLVLSVKKQGGAIVHYLKKLELYEINGAYLSEGLTIEAEKTYEITDFFVLDENNKVIYMTPKAGSDFAVAVNTPLDKEFNSGAGAVKVTMDVVATDCFSCTAEDFGYDPAFNVLDCPSDTILTNDTIITPVGNISTEDLITYYSFDGNTNDKSESTNVHNAKRFTGTITYGVDRFGNNNKAAVFDGASSLQLDKHSELEFGSNNFTISVWVKFHDLNNSKNRGTIVTNSYTGREGFQLANYKVSDNNFKFGGGCFKPGVSSSISFDYTNDNKWVHVILVRKDGKNQIYINGQLKAEKTSMDINVNHPHSFIKIGYLNGAYYKGLMDDFRIYKRGLSDEEILSLYYAEKN